MLQLIRHLQVRMRTVKHRCLNATAVKGLKLRRLPNLDYTFSDTTKSKSYTTKEILSYFLVNF